MITGKVNEKPLKGLTSTLSDYDCGDGELQVCHNMLNDGAGLRPVEDVQVLSNIPTGYELLYVHHTPNGSNYIVMNSKSHGALFGYDEDGNRYAITSNTGNPIYWTDGGAISSVGNILIYNQSDTTIHYIKWSGEEDGYEYLGDKIPELKLEFALYYPYPAPETKVTDGFSLTTGLITSYKSTSDESNYTFGTIAKAGKEEWEAIAYDAIMGTVLKVEAEEKKNNRFVHPFLVRYAYELYDGSLINHSIPILMLPPVLNPTISAGIHENDSGVSHAAFKTTISNCVFSVKMRPYYLRLRRINNPELSSWNDLITSIKIYISAPIYPYTEDGEKITIGNCYLCNTYNYAIGGVSESSSTTHSGGNRSNYPSKSDGSISYEVSRQHWGGISYGGESIAGLGNRVVLYAYLPDLSIKAYNKKIEDANLFYLFKEYNLDEIEALSTTEFQKIDVIEGTLTNIETREQMKDDYHSHDIITAKVMNSYNSRLNKANCKLIPFNNMPGEWLSCYSEQESEDSTASYTFSADIYIKDNGVTLKVSTTDVKLGLVSGYFFYPNPNAYLMILKRVGTSGTQYARLTLKQHPSLFGSYYFQGFDEEIPWSSTKPTEAVTTGATCFNYPNYMYTSEVDNPFVFPAEGLNAVGTGEIIDVKTATKAMSQGTAFGTNPLYAFCTDGVWALEVGSTGIYTAKQPVSRETLLGNSALSATQIDNSILFLSERGLMELTGGQTTLLSGALRELHSTFDVTALPHWSDIHKKYGGSEYLEADDFMSYINGARIAFDYVRYRIYVFRPYSETDTMSHTAYVYDVAAKAWGTVENRLLSITEDSGTIYVNKATEEVNDVEYKYVFNNYVKLGTLASTDDITASSLSENTLYDVTIDPDDGETESCGYYLCVDNGAVHWLTESDIFSLTVSIDSNYPAGYYYIVNNGEEDVDIQEYSVGATVVGKFVSGGDTLSGDGKGFYTTRPMKLDAPDALKTVRTLVERGVWKSVKYLAMWGSRDLRHWALIGAVVGNKMPRLSGTPYKYFIVGGWTDMTVNGDVISRLTMDVAAKYQDKIR